MFFKIFFNVPNSLGVHLSLQHLDWTTFFSSLCFPRRPPPQSLLLGAWRPGLSLLQGGRRTDLVNSNEYSLATRSKLNIVVFSTKFQPGPPLRPLPGRPALLLPAPPGLQEGGGGLQKQPSREAVRPQSLLRGGLEALPGRGGRAA